MKFETHVLLTHTNSRLTNRIGYLLLQRGEIHASLVVGITMFNAFTTILLLMHAFDEPAKFEIESERHELVVKELGQNLEMQLQLVENLRFRAPLQISLGTDEFTEVLGKTGCGCLRFDKLAVANGKVTGSLLVRPGSENIDKTAAMYGRGSNREILLCLLVIKGTVEKIVKIDHELVQLNIQTFPHFATFEVLDGTEITKVSHSADPIGLNVETHQAERKIGFSVPDPMSVPEFASCDLEFNFLKMALLAL